MTEFNYNQTIEYTDGTRDLNFEAAREWALKNCTTFEENIDARVTVDGVLKRYFVIGAEPEKPAPIEHRLCQNLHRKKKSSQSETKGI